MSNVVSGAKSGKGDKKVAASFTGKLTAAQWADFKEKLRALAKRSGVGISIAASAKKSK